MWILPEDLSVEMSSELCGKNEYRAQRLAVGGKAFWAERELIRLVILEPETYVGGLGGEQKP